MTKRPRRKLNLPRVPAIRQTEKIHQPKAKARKVKHKGRVQADGPFGWERCTWD